MSEKKHASPFEILSQINCNEHVEQKNGLSYLSWAWAWGELKKLYPRSYTTVYEDPNGCIYFSDGATCWVKTGVTLVEEDGTALEHIEYLPVMDNRNQSIKLEAIKSTDVNKAIQRSLTKAIARHGLGLYIYAGEDLPETLCEDCGAAITGYVDSNGKLIPATKIVEMMKSKYGKALCTTCGAKAKAAALGAKMKKEDKQSE
jgi:hypothetical protein